MPDIEELEQYFDALLKKDEKAVSSHPLHDDATRFALYEEIKKLFSKVSVNMDCMAEVVAKLYPSYVEILHGLAVSLGAMSHIENEAMDGYLRTLAVDRLVYNSEGLRSKETTQEQIGYLVQGLMVLFFEEGEEVVVTLDSVLAELKDKKAKLFKKKQDEQVREYLADTMEVYEEIEHDLQFAKQGVMSRDKKMVEVLRQLKLKMGGCIVEAAIKQMKTQGKKAIMHGIKSKAWKKDKNSSKNQRNI